MDVMRNTIVRTVVPTFLALGLINCSAKNFGSLASSEPEAAIAPPSLTPPSVSPPSGIPCASNCSVSTPPAPSMKTESFSQSTPDMDLLMVSDNSASTEDLQKSLVNKFGGFATAMQGIDYQIGITTTDVSGGKWSTQGSLVNIAGGSGYYLNPASPNVSQYFADTVQRKETKGCFMRFDCPSDDSQNFGAVVMAMQKHQTANAGFFRDNKNLAVLFITDGDNQSPSDNRDPKNNVNNPALVLSTFQAQWGNTKSLRAYGVIVKPGDKKCSQKRANFTVDPSTLRYSNYVDQFVQQTGGSSISLCDADYSPILNAIAQDVGVNLNRSFQLSQMPKADSVQVQVIPNAMINYHVVGDTVIFDQAPPVGSQIKVTYEE